MTYAMSMSNLSIDGEFRYIIQWFHEWSELQRDDFVPVLVDCLNQDKSGVVYMNGVMNAVANSGVADKPMSLFQCRIKLFREWTPKWPAELRHTLKEKIIEIDSKVGEKIINDIKPAHADASSNGSAIQTNGNEATELKSEFIPMPATAARGSEDNVQITDVGLAETTVTDNDETVVVSVDTAHDVSLMEPTKEVQTPPTD